MKLTKDNLYKWKGRLNKKMKDRYGIDEYSECKPDEEWLEDYLDASEEEAISDEIQYWEE